MGEKLWGGSPGTLTPGQSIYEDSTSAVHDIGERLQVGERIFYYGKTAAACAAGLCCAPDESVIGTNGLLGDGSCVLLAAETVRKDQPAITAALAVGNTWLAVTHASSLDNVVENSLQGGYIVLTDSAGINQIYRIKYNSVIASDVVAIELHDPIRTATADASTGVGMIQNPFNNLRPGIGDTDQNPSGAPQILIASGSYGWFQTFGPGMCLVEDDTAVAGSDAYLDDGSAGELHQKDDDTDVRVGYFMTDVTATSDAGLCMYQIMA